MWLVWLSMLPPCSGLWSWHWTRKGNHHRGIRVGFDHRTVRWGRRVKAPCEEENITHSSSKGEWVSVTQLHRIYHLDSGVRACFVSWAAVKLLPVVNCQSDSNTQSPVAKNYQLWLHLEGQEPQMTVVNKHNQAIITGHDCLHSLTQSLQIEAQQNRRKSELLISIRWKLIHVLCEIIPTFQWHLTRFSVLLQSSFQVRIAPLWLLYSSLLGF